MLQNHGEGSCSVAVANGRKRLHTTFSDQTEMVEEFDIISDELLVKKWKSKSVIGKPSMWEYEIGDPPATQSNGNSSIGISSSALNPIFLCRSATEVWEWRIRNLPYPESTYQLSIDEEKQDIVLRTTNKKYYKRFKVPELCRRGIRLDQSALSLSHSNNTLIIQYDKPDEVLEVEASARAARRGIKASKEGDVDCKQQ